MKTHSEHSTVTKLHDHSTTAFAKTNNDAKPKIIMSQSSMISNISTKSTAASSSPTKLTAEGSEDVISRKLSLRK
jgi:hypothetical protein